MTRPTSRLDAIEASLGLCNYCPSLCKHTCPVATVEARESVTPWGLMSLVEHLRSGRVELTGRIAETLHHCAGCRACTAWCVHEVDVEASLVEARAWAVERGFIPFPADRFAGGVLSQDEGALGSAQRASRYEAQPAFALLPGRATLEHAPEAVEQLLGVCERLEVDTLSCGDASALDVGYELWFSGHHEAFVAQARRVAQALVQAREVVVMSPEALYTLREIYPRFGVTLSAELVHTSDFLLPLLGGAVVQRLPGRFAYHDGCHLARHLGGADVPREVLRRVLAEPLVELPYRREETLCCGGSGCLSTTAPDVARDMAVRVVELALEAGVRHLVSFSPECVASLRAVAGDRLWVEHGVSLVASALESEDEEDGE